MIGNRRGRRKMRRKNRRRIRRIKRSKYKDCDGLNVVIKPSNDLKS
jgi:hypothetical protein